MFVIVFFLIILISKQTNLQIYESKTTYVTSFAV